MYLSSSIYLNNWLIPFTVYRNADGTIFPKSSALRLTTHRLTVESDGKEDSRSPRSPSSPSASTSRHNSFAMVAENGDNSFDGRTVSQDCSSPKGGGRHIQTRELAPSEKIGDAELRREVSDFIRFAKRGNISNGKKKNQLALGKRNINLVMHIGACLFILDIQAYNYYHVI